MTRRITFVTFVTGSLAGPDLFLSRDQQEYTDMGMWTAIALICIAGIASTAWRQRHQHADGKQVNERLDDLAQRMEKLDTDLRERVEVLERIVTDRHEDLKRQFDHLDKAS